MTFVPFLQGESIGTAEAAKRAEISPRTMREWVALHRLGRRVGGRWRISAVALDMYLAGDVAALDMYLDGDRKADAVTRYFEKLGIAI